jgi:hypothetical protein
MQMQNRHIILVSTIAIAALATLAPELVLAKMNIPGYVDSAHASDLESAGETINTWIFSGMAIVVAAFAVRPGFLFITGRAEEGWRAAKDILIGVVLAVVLGGIAFSVAGS